MGTRFALIVIAAVAMLAGCASQPQAQDQAADTHTIRQYVAAIQVFTGDGELVTPGAVAPDAGGGIDLPALQKIAETVTISTTATTQGGSDQAASQTGGAQDVAPVVDVDATIPLVP